MSFVKYNLKQKVLFHYTTKENADKIIKDKEIKTGNDEYCFFTASKEDARKVFF